MQGIKVNLVLQKQCLKIENVYLTKTILIYIIYTLLNVSVQIQMIHVETTMSESYAKTKLKLIKV